MSLQDQTSSVECEVCPGKKLAQTFCITCYATICKECHLLHNKMYSGHTIVPMSHFVKEKQQECGSEHKQRKDFIVPLNQEEEQKEEQKCEFCCGEDPAILFCNDCDSCLCDACVSQHQKVRALKKHTLVPLKEKEEQKEEQKCEFCCEDPALLFCNDCGSCLCDACVSQHRRIKSFKKHSLVPLKEKGEQNSSTCLPSKVKSKMISRP